jgi:hypothetical protein
MLSPETEKPPICPTARQVSTGIQQDDVPARMAPADARVSSPPATRSSYALHATFLGVALVVVSASFFLRVRGGEQVVVPLVNKALPGTCTFRRISGMPCPGCGLTRSFISMAHGRFADAWNFNPAGLFFFVVVAFQIPYRMYQIARIRRGEGPHRFAWIDTWVLLALVGVLLLQWTYHMVVRLV